MKNTFINALTIVCTILICTVAGYSQTSASYNRVTVKDTLALSGTKVAEIVTSISGSSKNNELPTAKSVHSYIQSLAYLATVARDSSLQGAGTAASPLGVKGYGAASNGQVPSKATGGITWITPLTAEVDGSVSNEGSLSVGAGGSNSSTVVSNTSGSTAVTISGSTTAVVTESGSTITIQADTSLIATVNDVTAARNRDDSTWVKYSGAYSGKRIGDNVYRYGTTSLRSSDTTGILNVYNNSTAKPGIYLKYNDASTNGFNFFQIDPDNQTDNSSLGSFNFWGTNFTGVNSPESSRANHVWRIGYNTGSGGGRQVTTDASLEIAFESNFYNNLHGGRLRTWEWHLQSQDTLGVVHRLISGVGAHKGDYGEISFDADRFTFKRYANAVAWLDADFYAHTVIMDTLTWIFDNPQVGYPFLRFRKNDDSGYLTMFQSDASDNLVINPAANDIYTYAPNLLFNTQATIATNDASAIQIGNSTKTSALSVYSSGTGIITMKNAAETTGWTHRVAATEYDLQTPGGNSPLIVHESAPQSSVYVKSDGDIGIGTGSPTARAHLYTSSGETKSMLKLENSTGTSQVFRNDDTPESAITGNPGDLTLANVSSTGKLFLKGTGVGNTGWAEVLTTSSGAAGSGAANQVTYWTGTNTVSGSANLTWDGTTYTVTGKGVYSVGNTFGANARGVDMSGNMTSNANSVSLEALRTSITFANSGAETSNNFRGIYTPTTTSGSTAGVHAGIWTAPTNSSTGVTSLYGIFGATTESSTSGNLSSRYGGFLSMDKSSNDNTTHSGVGIKGRIRDQSTSGRWSTAYGLEAEVTNGQNAYGVYIGTSNSRGTGNSITGIRIGSTVSGSGVVADVVKGVDMTFSETSSGSVTTYYGLYNAAAANATTNYMLYNSTDFRNYLNGSLALGVDVTTAKLFVRGTGNTSGTSGLIVENSDGTDVLTVRDDQMSAFGTTPVSTARLTVRGSTSDNTAKAFVAERSSGTALLGVQNDGKVSINNAAYTEELTINGQAQLDGVILTNQTGSTTTSGHVVYNNGSGGTYSGYLTVGDGTRQLALMPTMIERHVIDYAVDWTTGRKGTFWTVPARFDGWKIAKAYIEVTSIGAGAGDDELTIEIGGVGEGVQIITAGTHTLVMDDVVNTDDVVTFNVTTISATPAKGLHVSLELSKN